MKLSVNIETDDQEAADDPEGTAATALVAIAARIEQRSDTSGTIRDANGNRIGSWTFTP